MDSIEPGCFFFGASLFPMLHDVRFYVNRQEVMYALSRSITIERISGYEFEFYIPQQQHKSNLHCSWKHIISYSTCILMSSYSCWTHWLPFCKRHFQKYSNECKGLDFNQNITDVISMAYCKTVVSPLLTYWIFRSHRQIHQFRH